MSESSPSASATDEPAELVLTERHGHIGVLKINRPEARNAISRAVTEQMAAAIESLESDPDIWVLVITGAGDKSFCAGADLKSMAHGSPSVPELGGFAGITHREFKRPVIAAVNGFALGGGTEICLASDLVVAESHATFGLPEVHRGIVAGAGGLERLPNRIPVAIAMEMILTGERISAERALELGLINRVVPQGTSLEAAIELAEKVCVGAPIAVQTSVRVSRASVAHGEERARELLMELRSSVIKSADAAEGRRAFAEKRSPRWTGA